eukprot:3764528-Pyramimonas_sp.AAC.1
MLLTEEEVQEKLAEMILGPAGDDPWGNRTRVEEWEALEKETVGSALLLPPGCALLHNQRLREHCCDSLLASLETIALTPHGARGCDIWLAPGPQGGCGESRLLRGAPFASSATPCTTVHVMFHVMSATN